MGAGWADVSSFVLVRVCALLFDDNIRFCFVVFVDLTKMLAAGAGLGAGWADLSSLFLVRVCCFLFF